MRRTTILLLVAVFGIAVVGCSSETRDKAKEAAESAKDDASDQLDRGSVRAQAETLRASLKADRRGDREGLRSMAVIEENVQDLPGDPQVEGLADEDGDGKDDDGKVAFVDGSRAACVTIPASGEDVRVTSGEC